MKTKQTSKPMIVNIYIDYSNEQSINRAERLKTKLENDGYWEIDTVINSCEDTAQITYKLITD